MELALQARRHLVYYNWWLPGDKHPYKKDSVTCEVQLLIGPEYIVCVRATHRYIRPYVTITMNAKCNG